MDDRIEIVRRLLMDYVRSPSLKHIRDGYAVSRLAAEIVRKLDRGSSAWRKWSGPREELVKAAAPCWIPVAALTDHLNAMPGPTLTTTDTAQRMRALQEDDAADYPNDEVREGCLALFTRERESGTELPAIVGAIQEFIEEETARLRAEWERRYKAEQEAKRRALENRFLAGADCPWTPIERSKMLFCRVNGRAYRLTPMEDGMWELYRIEGTDHAGIYVGRYRQRRDATTAVNKVAYGPDLLTR